MLKKHVILILFIALLSAVISCSGDDSETVEEESAISVSTVPVQTRNVDRGVDLLGDVSAQQEVRVFSKVADRIIRFDVDMGDRVEEGSLIAVVENSTIQSAVNQVEANLEQAKAQLSNLETEYNRMQQLYAQNAVSEQQYDGVKTQMEATRAQVKALRESLNQAKTRLEDSYIRAPITGVIGQRFFDAGDMANPQTPVVTVVQMDTVKVLVNVVELYVKDLRVVLPVHITFPLLGDSTFFGKVIRISPVFDPRSRMLLTEVKIPNPEWMLRPGMFADVRIILDSHPNAMVIPQYAILQKTELELTKSGRQEIVRESHVYVVNDSMAHYRTIEPGYQDGEYSEVLSGLQPGDQVVILGQNNLEDSTRVRVVEMRGESI